MDKKILSEEIVKKLKGVSCVEEVEAIIKAAGIELTPEEIAMVFTEAQKNTEGELSDDELDAVSGGTSYYANTGAGGYGDLITTSCNSCPAWENYYDEECDHVCRNCKYSYVYEGISLRCSLRNFHNDPYRT